MATALLHPQAKAHSKGRSRPSYEETSDIAVHGYGSLLAGYAGVRTGNNDNRACEDKEDQGGQDKEDKEREDDHYGSITVSLAANFPVPEMVREGSF